jgi:hypothetical protein
MENYGSEATIPSPLHALPCSLFAVRALPIVLRNALLLSNTEKGDGLSHVAPNDDDMPELKRSRTGWSVLPTRIHHFET